jgi:hypothetical protein
MLELSNFKRAPKFDFNTGARLSEPCMCVSHVAGAGEAIERAEWECVGTGAGSIQSHAAMRGCAPGLACAGAHPFFP